MTVAYVSPANPERSRPAVAYAIGRRHGNAVHRNRLRRRLREAMASAAQELPAGEYLVRARPEAETAPFSDLCRAIATAAMGAASQVSRPDDQWGG